ncbi:MAG TPA: hypothetical protein PK018_16655, partial [Candidatus Competibacter sp.]|nr:hypothetical protein [Candidatus Competibacter sp.]
MKSSIRETHAGRLWTLDRRFSYPKTMLLMAALLLSGCAAVGPNYVAPDPAPPATWQGAAAAQATISPTTPEDLATWWKQLDDPTLTTLI